MKIWKKAIPVVLLICICLHILPVTIPVQANASGMREIDKVAISFSMPPVAAADVSALKASISTGGCYIESVAWYDIYGQLISNKFTNNNATVEMVIRASTGHCFPENVSVTIGGEPVGMLNNGDELRVSKTFAPVIWVPTMVKHPGDETVEVGGIASFVSYSSCTDKSSWQIVDTEGNSYSAEAFAEKYPKLIVQESFEKLNIKPVTMELDGYKVRCCFSGPGGDIDSKYALLTVVEELEEDGEEPAGETAQPAPTPEHEHVFSTELSSDAGYHWYGCTCGEAKDKSEHEYKWVQIKAAELERTGLVRGECTVCGHVMEAKTELSALAAAAAAKKAEEASTAAVAEKAEEISTAAPTEKAEEVSVAEDKNDPLEISEQQEEEKQGFIEKITSFFQKSSEEKK